MNLQVILEFKAPNLNCYILPHFQYTNKVSTIHTNIWSNYLQYHLHSAQSTNLQAQVINVNISFYSFQVNLQKHNLITYPLKGQWQNLYFLLH